MSWPPDLAFLKRDQKITDERDDARLADMLAAAVSFVQEIHRGRFDFGEIPEDVTADPLPTPGAQMELGTVRLAVRWSVRGRSPDGLVNSGELGLSRVTTFDPDIDRQLRIGRYAPSVIA
jgi:hypothetical protein